MGGPSDGGFYLDRQPSNTYDNPYRGAHPPNGSSYPDHAAPQQHQQNSAEPFGYGNGNGFPPGANGMVTSSPAAQAHG